MNVLAFDIETVPDTETGRRLLDLGDLDDQDTGRAMLHRRRQETGGRDFLPLHLHRVVAISVALRQGDRFRVWTLGDRDAGEAEMIARFYEGLERFQPDLVSWNGAGFDLPVLHYRALLHGVPAPAYWETGDNAQAFRWNNYLNRFHWRHLDLMDVMAGFQGRGTAKLEEVAVMLGLPGKLGMHGSLVWDRILDGDIQAVRDYCETDALNTYLVYLRFEVMRGRLDAQGYADEQARVHRFLETAEGEHFQQFLAGWEARPLWQGHNSQDKDSRGTQEED
ncbi:putative PolB exonuclease-like 3'-5' exonuclease [Natronospira proteinivora]|uniref:PolB exonuclease-like 3'-5' exonuclease n=1 Tax=Natronospira proteinivora TaxID=1807133 RepID=A0ABT1G6V2_9GAMM|nr:putative PolB exonuclease-like 3'-5' exonuclease [Natronospira proteinivora]